jgi:hypothetical protein
MLESFFILSLGITFVLVVFLVYHFKQRLSVLENKCDTTFEIINNVVSELGNMRSAIYASSQHSLPDMSTSHNMIQSPIANAGDNRINVEIDSDVSDDEDSDDEDSDAEDSGDEDSGDEDSDDEESGDKDSGDEDSCDVDTVNIEVEEVSITEDHNILNESNPIRIINIENQPEIDVIDVAEDNIPLETDEDDQPDIENMEATEIHVEKLNNDESHLDDLSVASSTVDTGFDNRMYKKMTISALKAYVIEKGIMSDPGKLKKHEIIEAIKASEI